MNSQDPFTAQWSIEDLLRSDAFPHEVSALQLRETHISWVILTGSFAYKIKKPVKLDFIDASTLEQRRHYCEEEVRLNRRTAPDLYIDVVAITLQHGRALIGGHGIAVEYAVRMRQFSPMDELPALLAKQAVAAEEMAALGELIAAFHRDAPHAPTMRAPEKTEQIHRAVFDNLQQLLDMAAPADPEERMNHLAAWTRDTAHELAATFQQREREGFIREGHGDLHAANIVRHEQRLVPFDCIEFDTRMRWIDVIDDISFLVMDLMSYGRDDLATTLLSRYLEVTGDYDGMQLLPFYATHRALVRAKVDALTARSVPARAAECRDRKEQRLVAAMTWTTPQRHPFLILMHGASGSGKSWLSDRLVPELPALRIRSDLERKRLAHLGPAQSAAAGVREGIYSPRFSERTYERLAHCAERCLLTGFSVIVDASFLDGAHRETFQALAARLGVPRLIVSCESDPIAASAHLLERSARGTDASDATLAVLDAQLREFKPFPPSERADVIEVDARAPHAVQHVRQEIRSRLAEGITSAHPLNRRLPWPRQ